MKTTTKFNIGDKAIYKSKEVTISEIVVRQNREGKIQEVYIVEHPEFGTTMVEEAWPEELEVIKS